MTNLAVAPAPVSPEIASSPRGSFWARVGRAYWRAFSTKIATVWIFLIVLISVFVPFIANGMPFTANFNGHREFPLFKDLTRVDWAWLTFAAGAVVYGVIHWRLGKKGFEARRTFPSPKKCRPASHLRRCSDFDIRGTS